MADCESCAALKRFAVPARKMIATAALAALLCLVLAAAAPLSLAQDKQAGAKTTAAAASPESEVQSAWVEVDGVQLFRVRGIEAFPAEKRAATIRSRIEEVAREPTLRADTVRTVEVDAGTSILVGERHIMTVVEADVRLEGVERKTVAAAYAARVGAAIEEYRNSRTREGLTRSGTRAGVATALLVVALLLVAWLSRRLHSLLEQHYGQRIRSVEIQSFQFVRAERIRNMLHGVLGTGRVAVVLIVAFFYLQYVLGLFPWTRGFARRLVGLVLGPLNTIGQGMLAVIPDLIFLAILFVVTRYILKLTRLFFGAVGRGEVSLAGFDADWAEPTYRLVRVAVIAFALVVAYPYIPGSGTDAFKGISIFMGVLFSLGASSAISNIIAGYMMTYRRAFRVGDRVQIGSTIGDVTEMRLQVTHLKTTKNEEVIVPNSTILNNEVVNYSSHTRGDGLILHTTVGIGYETPWRQVEAMLLTAAERTHGLMKEPLPFIRQKALGDFAVTYELNAYCNDAQAMGALYTELHRNILDVFNEYGVQIMTPAYEGDPEVPKVVPREQWYNAPASKADAGSR